MSGQTDLEGLVLDELGVDIYSAFDKERYFLTPEVQHAIYVACLTAFCKGFFGLDSLGKGLREKLLHLLTSLRSRDGLAAFSDDGESTALFTEARRQMREASLPDAERAAQAEVEQYLRDFGMHAQVAARHAQRLSAIFRKALADEPA